MSGLQVRLAYDEVEAAEAAMSAVREARLSPDLLDDLSISLATVYSYKYLGARWLRRVGRHLYVDLDAAAAWALARGKVYVAARLLARADKIGEGANSR